MKLTANVALLTLLKNYMVLKICSWDDSPYLRSSTTGYPRVIRAYRPRNYTQQNFPFTRQGLTDALKWASEGYVTWTQDAKENACPVTCKPTN